MNWGFFKVSPDKEIVSTRIFNFPKETLFRAWSDPELLAKWWGPAGFTNTFHKFDFRMNGIWRFTMHSPDKKDHENEVVFGKIQAPHMISWDRITKPFFRVVATFHETEEGHTKLVFRMQFETKKACDNIRAFAGDKNEENFDRLEAVLSTMENRKG